MKTKLNEDVTLIDESFQVIETIGQEWLLCLDLDSIENPVLIDSNAGTLVLCYIERMLSNKVTDTVRYTPVKMTDLKTLE